MKRKNIYLKVLLFSMLTLNSYGQETRLRNPESKPDFVPVCFHYEYGYINKTGDMVVPLQFREARNFSEGLAAVKIDERWGYIDKTGKIVVPAQFNEVLDFSEGLATVNINRKYGYIDKLGKTVIELQFADAYSFHEGLAIVNINGKYGYIDKLGKIVIEPQFARACDFSDGLACVNTEPTNYTSTYGYINKRGEMIIKPKYADARDFSEGLAAVWTRIDQWVYIDKTGKEVFNKKFYWAYGFSGGVAPVKLDNGDEKVVYIDKTGEKIEIIPLQLRLAKVKGVVGVETSDGSIDYITETGKVVMKLKPHSFSPGDFSEGLAVTKEGYVDKTGNIVIPRAFEMRSSFHDGLARVGNCVKRNAGIPGVDYPVVDY